MMRTMVIFLLEIRGGVRSKRKSAVKIVDVNIKSGPVHRMFEKFSKWCSDVVVMRACKYGELYFY